MIDKVMEYIKENHMLERGDKLVLGVSGGADSTALFEVMCRLSEEYDLSLYVVHINHGIRKEAGEDAEYVRSMCEKHDVSFFLFEEDIPALAERERLTEEEAGRKFRYECFRKVMRENGATKLAVAHHMDDQAETVLFHLIRGTDISGMTGMRPVSPLTPAFGNTDGLLIIRPLLGVRRDEITAWLEEKGISWQEDATNNDDNYARNRIRNRVMSDLAEVNEKAAVHINEFAELSAEYDGYIGKQAAAFIEKEAVDLQGRPLSCYDKVDCGGMKIRREQLLSEDKVIVRRVLYELLTMVCGARKDITRQHVEALNSLLEALSGKEVHLPYDVKGMTSYEWLIIRKEEAGNVGIDRIATDPVDEIFVSLEDIEASERYEVKLKEEKKMLFSISDISALSVDDKNTLFGGSENLQKNYTKYFDCDTIEDTLYIRYPKSEDYMVCDSYGHTKKLSKLFKDIKLPREERKAQVVLAAGHEILWVPGSRRCEAHYISSDTRRILKVEYV